ncbi:MAG: HAD family hydrolase [Tannerellaceae bacterium]|jgi:D-glycero-D-manno-heptose 1,7-bisphosphate phosphatase/D-glycero-alpha-D-manno-heptose 1-phosphate guanylyltransferase|nr:HAD family hydrolase [Tannerellaceae bacterium]
MENIKPYNTLFLDRDGVINIQRKGDYVKSVDEFVFTEGSLEALKILSSLFTYLIIVTNQRGVGRGLMTLKQLDEIHTFMLRVITSKGGRIDKIYFCPDTNKNSINRKPNIGMALQAKRDFPGIDFSKSILAGDSISDMQFAEKAGIPAILIGNKYKPEEIAHLTIQGYYLNLLTFAKHLDKD